MAYTQEQVDTLEEAIAAGVLSVRNRDGTSVTYQSLDAMRKARTEMLREIEGAAGAPKRRRTMRLYQRGTGL
jgi:hypothetical protein